VGCVSCHAELPAGARFCPSCGEKVTAERVLEARKTVTVIFCDLVGSTALSTQLDPESLRALMLRYFALMRDCLEHHGGVVEKYIGDAVMAVFGVPVIHEDDALRAVRAAVQMRAALDGFNREVGQDLGVRLSVRIGVNTGPVVAAAYPGAAEVIVSGETVNLAARLEQHAAPGEILLGPLTCQAVQGMVDYQLAAPAVMKGIAAPVTPGRLVAVGESSRPVRRNDLAMVNRQAEMAALRAAFGDAVRDRGCRLVTLHGDPGIGKSRLAGEFAAWAREAGALIAEGRCLGYGTGGSLHALAEAIRELLAGWTRPPVRRGEQGGHGGHGDHGAGADLAEALTMLEAGLLADGSPGIVPGETAWAVGRVLEEVGRDRPLVLILDDMHWADPALLAMITSLAGRLSLVAAVVLCLVRPEFVAEHGGWDSALPNASSELVGPLGDDDCYLLVSELDEVLAHGSELAVRAVSRAEGNPLYLEQLVTVITGDSAQAIPVGINGLIAYRLDLLAPGEREVLGLAAVAGREFTLAGITAAADGELGLDTGSALAALVRRRLIRAVPGPGGTEGTKTNGTNGVAATASYRFESALVHEVAYESLPKGWRADRHERLATALAVQDGDAEVTGSHWERAWLLRRELGLPEAAWREPADRAVTALQAAGARALAGGDVRHAAGLLGRALSICPAADPRVPGLMLQAGEAELMTGEIDAGRRLLEDARDGARGQGNAVIVAHVELQLAYLSAAGQFAASLQAARRTLPVFEAAGDDLGITRAWLRIGVVEQSRGRHASAASAFGRALERTARLDAELEHATVLGALAVSLWRGPRRAAEAITRCRSLLGEHAAGRRAVRAALICPLAMLVGMTGEHDEAAALLADAEHIVGDLGNAHALAVLPIFAAAASSLAGDLTGAEALLRRAHAACLAIRDPQLAETASRDLARVRLRQGCDDEAAELADAPVPDDVPAAVAERSGVLARVFARRGDAGQARRLSSLALAAARRTDSPVTQATACLDAAVALDELGDKDAARPLARRAARSFAGKGHLVGVSWAHEVLGEAS
jgi:class 3 adenylate cyclase/tetratricopeptide (TPR) repeat protein